MDSFEEMFMEVAKEIEEDVVEEWTPSSNPECELCGEGRFQVDQIESESKIEFYSVDCIGHRCDGTLSFTYLFVEVGESIPIVNWEFRGVRCTGEKCDGESVSLGDAVERNDPYESEEYVLPIKGILTTTLHEHHTSYEPEVTMTVCPQCHRDIHTDDDFRPDLRPDMSWKEWNEKHD